MTAIDWRAVERVIPACFTDDGCSSPLRGLHPYIYTARFRAAAGRCCRIHDYLYWVGRLPDGPLDGIMGQHQDRRLADAVFRVALSDAGYPAAAWIYWIGVRVGGRRAWRANWRRMMELGYWTYADWLRIKGCREPTMPPDAPRIAPEQS